MNWGRYMITIENLNYRHKNCNKSNLENVNVDFKPGIVNVIIGKNGSGKTTLFDLITNVIPRPDVIKGVPNHSEIIYQLQGLSFPSTLKGKDLFRFFLYTDHNNSIKVSNTPYTDKYMESSEIELMEKVWDTQFGQLSIGERRYLSILAVTLMQRKLYVFDEPTSGVDPEARLQILKRIERLTLGTSSTVILSTHTLHEFRNIHCKIHLLHKGCIRFQGTYEQFTEKGENGDPDSAFYQNLMLHQAE
ncbi:ABC-2 type transport system ATP-binding protein [Paenibacillus alvei]|uniref:ABC-2 type transport system ATP-binding protein n=2 Tax=Paenibacillus alvei TaxID=44250 RepID=A0A383R7I2_PAEAL|nr:ABC-2 type transport system ATP-binding protein [Paenibacillus alvei]